MFCNCLNLKQLFIFVLIILGKAPAAIKVKLRLRLQDSRWAVPCHSADFSAHCSPHYSLVQPPWPLPSLGKAQLIPSLPSCLCLELICLPSFSTFTSPSSIISKAFRSYEPVRPKIYEKCMFVIWMTRCIFFANHNVKSYQHIKHMEQCLLPICSVVSDSFRPHGL